MKLVVQCVKCGKWTNDALQDWHCNSDFTLFWCPECEAKRQVLLAAGQFFIDSDISLEALWRKLGDKITDYNKLLD